MKTILSTLKIIGLTIITGGLYGAYWIVVNMFRTDDDPSKNESERKAGEAQNTVALAWLHFITK